MVVRAEPLPVVTAVPRRLRTVCVLTGALVVATFVVVAVLLKDSAIGTEFTTADQIGIGGLGVLIAAGIGLLGRPSVRADAEGIHIQNIVVRHDLPWQVVREVHFGYGAPWATLDLHDDEEIAVLAVQAADREYAVAAMRGLRALHTAAVGEAGHRDDIGGAGNGTDMGDLGVMGDPRDPRDLGDLDDKGAGGDMADRDRRDDGSSRTDGPDNPRKG